ncbi:UNVERIFIED_CONTAM: Integrator complex subunit 6 [Siphonaria sp. JEL0065]|nr:Integrator complex subunit 6 [Siphonaria sp. JEL0065]
MCRPLFHLSLLSFQLITNLNAFPANEGRWRHRDSHQHPTRADILRIIWPANCSLTYSVRIGDTFFDVAKTLGVSLAFLENLNPGTNYDMIYPNQTICIFWDGKCRNAGEIETRIDIISSRQLDPFKSPTVSQDAATNYPERIKTVTVESTGMPQASSTTFTVSDQHTSAFPQSRSIEPIVGPTTHTSTKSLCEYTYLTETGDSCWAIATAFNMTISALESMNQGLDCTNEYFRIDQVLNALYDLHFIVDTSASMNQIFSHDLSYLDCAKSGIEHFFQATIHDSIPQLLKELKTLTATDISNPGHAFNAAFDYLNTYRYQAGLETHGKERYFTSIESTVVMWFTDGGNFSFIDPPISEMSNHHSKPCTPPLRNPFESDEVILSKAKRDPFGNPWVTKTKNPSLTPSSPTLVLASTDDDEISNETSFISGSGKDIADAAKLAADLENAAAHARKLPRRRTRSNNTSPSSRSSEYSASVAGSILEGSVTSSLRSDRFVLDRVPNLVDYFPVLVLPPPCSYQEVESGLVDISAWVEKFRLDAQAKKAEADELERVKK